MVTPSCQLTAATPHVNRPRETRTPCPLEPRPDPRPTRPKFQDRINEKPSSSRRKKRRNQSHPPTTSSRQIAPMWIPSTIYRSPDTRRIDENPDSSNDRVTITDEQSRRGFEKRPASARIFRNSGRVYPPGYLVP